MDNVISIEKLLSLGWNKKFDCSDRIKKEENAVVYGLGNSYVPDHELVCTIPDELRPQFDYKTVNIQIHIIWLLSNKSYYYDGLVIDKTDCKLYFATIYTENADDPGTCCFAPASAEKIHNLAQKYNLYLDEVVNISLTDRKKLLNYQLYSNLSDRFYYMEMPFEDRVVMCGVGLHTNKLLAVGWLGKLINKDFFIAYGECTPEVYQQLKEENASLYERGQLMEKNKHLFSCYNVICEKRKKYPSLLNIINNATEETVSQRNMSFFTASPNGTVMKEYNGPAYRWMEDFLKECKKCFYN